MLDANSSRIMLYVLAIVSTAIMLVFIFGSNFFNDESDDGGYVQEVSTEMLQKSEQRRHKY